MNRLDILERYFTKTGCGMTASGEDDNLICPQKFKAGDYSFQYTPDNAELQPAARLGGAAEPAAPDDAMLETLGDAMINTMERDNGDIEDSGVIVGGNGEMDDDAYELIEALEAKKRSNKEYVWAEEPTGGSTGLKPGDAIVFFFEWGWERGAVQSMKKCSKHQKEVAEDSTTPVLVRYVIDGDYILQDFGDDEVSYLSKDQFDKLAAGEQEAAQGVNLNAWCVVKLE